MKRGVVVMFMVLALLLVTMGLVLAGGPEYNKLIKDGDKLCMKGEYVKARAVYRRAIIMNPNEETGWNKYDEAIIKLSKKTHAAPAVEEEEEEPGGC